MKENLTAKRSIKEIIVHCTATKVLPHINANDVRRWHMERGFSDIGYHYLVLVDGSVETGRPLSIAGAHCKGHNAHSIGICYVGGVNAKGVPADTRTPAQREALHNLLISLKRQFPKAVIYGHRDFAAKACPCFDATKEYAYLSIESADNHDLMRNIDYLILILILGFLFLCPSCKSLAPTITVPHNDSIVIRNIYHHDSIFLHDSMTVAMIHDTVYIRKWHTDIRYSVKYHTDTLYNDKEVIITPPPEKYIPSFYRWCTRILIVSVLSLILYFILRVILRYYTLH